MKLLREVTFFAAAFSLANVWFVLLLIPWGTRKMLLADPSPRYVTLCVIGVMFALVFRRWVTRAFSPERGAAMALLIPVAGAVLFSSAFAMSEWSWRDANVMGLVLSVLMTLVYVIGGAYYVILPMSAITVFLMRKLALALWPQPRVANGEEFWW